MNLLVIPKEINNLSPLTRASFSLQGSKKYSLGTVKQTEQLCKEFNTWNSGKPIKVETIKAFLQERSKTTANDTVRQNKYLLKSILVNNFPELNNYKGKKLLDLELGEISIPASPTDKTGYVLSEEILRAVLQHFKPKQVLFIKFLYQSACRVSEALGAKLSNCKTVGEEVHIDIIGKGNKRRYLRIDKELFEEIKMEFKSSVYLFQNHNHKNTSGKYSTQYLFEVISRIELYTGMPFSPHKLRHSRLTNLVEQGESVQAVQELAGHSSVITTAKYYLHSKVKDIKKGAL